MQDEVQKSNSAIGSMYAAINHIMDSDLRLQIVCQLEILLQKMAEKDYIYKLNDVKEFITELKKGKLSLERAFYWYTVHGPIYKFTNNLLRLSLQPTKIYYIQPYIKDLFDSVMNMHQIYLNSSKNEQKYFICYRGATLSPSEMDYLANSVNKVVQNLGFLSASIDLEIAESYTTNAFFEIAVRDVPRNKQIDFGYAFIR